MSELSKALFEKSKYDDALIVGSEIRAALQEQANEIERLEKEVERLREAMQEFVDRCDKGEARSIRTYGKFKELLDEPR